MIRHTLAATAFALMAPALEASDDPLAFREISIIFEINETDGDGEIVVRAKTFEGLKRFWLRRPDGKKVAEVTSDDKTKVEGPIGIQQVRLETAEPSMELVMAAYPEGIYEFHGRTTQNDEVYGEVVLTHDLVPAPSFTPADGDLVDADDTVVEWGAVSGAAFYIVEVENDDLAVNLTAIVAGDQTSLRLPAGFLRADTEYDLGVASMTVAGNVAFAESSFVTLP